MEPFGPDFRFREAPPSFADYQRFILEHYDAEEVPISAFSHSLDRMLRFNCFHSVDNRPRRSMDDFVFTAYLLPRTPRNEELYERPPEREKAPLCGAGAAARRCGHQLRQTLAAHAYRHGHHTGGL